LYRMFDSSYVFKRLIKDYPRFVFIVLKDFLSERSNNV